MTKYLSLTRHILLDGSFAMNSGFFGGLSKEDSIIQFDSNKVHYNELIVTGTTACSTYDCWRAAEIVNSGRLDLAGLITSRFPLSEAPAAFAAAADGKNLRVSLEP